MFCVFIYELVLWLNLAFFLLFMIKFFIFAVHSNSEMKLSWLAGFYFVSSA